MALLPTEDNLTNASTTNAQQKTNFANLRNFIADLLGTDSSDKAAARTALGAAKNGVVTGSGLTMATARLLGRTTASDGAVEEIALGSGLVLYAGVLSKNRAYAEYASNAALTNTIAINDSVPTNTAGTQILSATITPSSSTARIRARVTGFGTVATAPGSLIAILFSSLSANALRTTASTISAAAVLGDINMEFEHVPGVTSAVTYTVRAGSNSGNAYFNGATSGRYFGGTSAVTLVLEEV